MNIEASLSQHYAGVSMRLGVPQSTPHLVKRSMVRPPVDEDAMLLAAQPTLPALADDFQATGLPVGPLDPHPDEPHELPPVGWWRILAAEVAVKHQVTARQVFSPYRGRAVCLARHEAFWRASVELKLSIETIARRFNRDHTSVLHGITKHAARVSS